MKALVVLGFIALASSVALGQSASGPVYWSATPPDCSTVSGPVAIMDTSGATIGYSCYMAGTFVWLAAGGGWSTSIRVAAPASGAIGADYSFYDTNGSDLTLDTTVGRGSSITPTNYVNFSLSANQPAEVDLLGGAGDGPAYKAYGAGSVYAVFYCPNAATCGVLQPQLIYSELPTTPWSLSVPIAWDTAVWTQWSAAGVDNGSDNLVALAIYNEGTTAAAYTVRVYDSTGALAGTGTTPVIPPFQPLANGFLGQAGTYGALLKDIISTPLPSGIFKVLIDGGSAYSAVTALQFSGASGTSLQVAYDYAPTTGAAAATTAGATPALLSHVRARVGSRPKTVFRELQR